MLQKKKVRSQEKKGKERVSNYVDWVGTLRRKEFKMKKKPTFSKEGGVRKEKGRSPHNQTSRGKPRTICL